MPTPAPPENGRFVPPWDLTEPPQQGKPDKAAADKFLRFKDEVVAKVKGLVGEEPTDAVNGTLPLQTEEGAYWELSEVKNLLVAELIEEFGQPTVVALDVELQRIDSADDIRRHLMTHPYGSGWCRSLPDFAMLDD